MQTFQVGVPAGIQSGANFHALLQSSVNFLSGSYGRVHGSQQYPRIPYVSINAVTQACRSFTSQKTTVGKYKRMDKV